MIRHKREDNVDEYCLIRFCINKSLNVIVIDFLIEFRRPICVVNYTGEMEKKVKVKLKISLASLFLLWLKKASPQKISSFYKPMLFREAKIEDIEQIQVVRNPV